MSAKSNVKSNNQKRGGKRPGAGRPRGPSVAEGASSVELLRNAAIDVALGGLDRALKAYETDDAPVFTPLQSRWHLAMVLFGVSPDTVAAALLDPQVSKNFSRDIADAIKAVEVACT